MARAEDEGRAGDRGRRMAPPRTVELGDLAAALGLLTRIPVRMDAARAADRGARAVWAYPLVGGLVGGLGGLAGLGAHAVGMPAAAAAGLAIAAQVLATGALHEDGLADLADGLGGGATPERRLEIMRDSRIGTFGAVALILVIGLRWSLLASLTPGAMALALIASGALSRTAMSLVMAALPPARRDGLAITVGRPGAVTAGLAALAGLAVAGICIGPAPSFVAAACVVPAAALVAAAARAKLGGGTGDVLGAAQQVGEVAALAALASLA